MLVSGAMFPSLSSLLLLQPASAVRRQHALHGTCSASPLLPCSSDSCLNAILLLLSPEACERCTTAACCATRCTVACFRILHPTPSNCFFFTTLLNATSFTFPCSLRALYGGSVLRNALHGSWTPAAAAAELRLFFPHLAPPLSLGDAGESGSAAAAAAFVEKHLHRALVSGLTAMAKSKEGSDPVVSAAMRRFPLLIHAVIELCRCMQLRST